MFIIGAMASSGFDVDTAALGHVPRLIDAAYSDIAAVSTGGSADAAAAAGSWPMGAAIRAFGNGLTWYLRELAGALDEDAASVQASIAAYQQADGDSSAAAQSITDDLVAAS